MESFGIGAVLMLTAMWFTLPIIPVFLSMLRVKEVEPLEVESESTRDVRHFARRFRSYLQLYFQQELADPPQMILRRGKLDNGEEFCIVADSDSPYLTESEQTQATTEKLFLFFKPTVLPDRMVFNKEIYSANSLVCGEDSVLRAVLADGDVQISRDSMVLRWLHAAGKVRIQQGVFIHGRLSSDTAIVLDAGSHFERMQAPEIEAGLQPIEFDKGRYAASATRDGSFVDVAGKRWVVKGDLDIPEGTVFRGSLVVTGALTVGYAARIMGSVKSRGKMQLDSGVHVEGSIISSVSIRISEDCMIEGPVIAEEEIVCGAHTRVGKPNKPTTVSAPRISLVSSSVCHGTVWARLQGKVVREMPPESKEV